MDESDFPEEMVGSVCEMLVAQLNRKYREVAREKFQASLASSLQNKKRTHRDLADRVNTVYTTVRLGEKAVSEFSKVDHRAALSKHLLKTHCTEVVNEMFQFVAEENMVKVRIYLNISNGVSLITDIFSSTKRRS